MLDLNNSPKGNTQDSLIDKSSFFKNRDGTWNFDNFSTIAGFGTDLYGAYLGNQSYKLNRDALNTQMELSKLGFNNDVNFRQGELNDRAERRAIDNAGGSQLTGATPQLQTFGSNLPQQAVTAYSPQAQPPQQVIPQNGLTNGNVPQTPISTFGINNIRGVG